MVKVEAVEYVVGMDRPIKVWGNENGGNVNYVDLNGFVMEVHNDPKYGLRLSFDLNDEENSSILTDDFVTTDTGVAGEKLYTLIKGYLKGLVFDRVSDNILRFVPVMNKGKCSIDGRVYTLQLNRAFLAIDTTDGLLNVYAGASDYIPPAVIEKMKSMSVGERVYIRNGGYSDLALKVIAAVSPLRYYRDHVRALGYNDYAAGAKESHALKCPLHEDSKPSLLISDNVNGQMTCFSCGFSGTILELHVARMIKERKVVITVEDAAESLYSHYMLGGDEVLPPAEFGNFDIFEDRVISLLKRWRKFLETNPNATHEDAVRGCMQEIGDDYSKALAEKGERE